MQDGFLQHLGYELARPGHQIKGEQESKVDILLNIKTWVTGLSFLTMLPISIVGAAEAETNS